MEVMNLAISLSKGQKVDLTKTNPGLTKVIVGLGWDTNRYDGGKDFDLDTSVFLLGENGKVNSDSDFVFYNNTTGGNGSVVHNGDNRTGEGDGDDEQTNIDLNNVPAISFNVLLSRLRFMMLNHEVKILDKFRMHMCVF